MPAELAQLAARAGRVVSSDAARAIASARLVAMGRDVVGARTALRSLRGKYPSPEEAARASNAVTWLKQLAAQDGLVIAMTHASFRQQLTTRLVQTGWNMEPGRRTREHWSAWIFSRRPVR